VKNRLPACSEAGFETTSQATACATNKEQSDGHRNRSKKT
jgi:hypothetical protein